MNRVDLEALVVRLIDQVQRSGAAAEYGVEDPSSLQEFLHQEARSRGFQINTGTLTADDHAVWAFRPKEDSDRPMDDAGRPTEAVQPGDRTSNAAPME